MNSKETFRDLLHSVIAKSKQLKDTHDTQLEKDLFQQELIRRAALKRTAMGETVDVVLTSLGTQVGS